MRLSISNIGWSENNDTHVYEVMKKFGFTGLEIAPTRIFPEKPYEKIDEACRWMENLQSMYGITIPSMQSIWYGKTEKIFDGNKERKILTDYTKSAIDFAEAIGCKNLVFGCSRNRWIPDNGNLRIARDFFREIGEYAYQHNTVIAMEANPPIYNTNFLNTTEAAIAFVEEIDSKGFLLNLDTGTMIENGESVSILSGKQNLINHVHISEIGLMPIQKRELHLELAEMLSRIGYSHFVSIEVGKQEDINVLIDAMMYVREVFG